jgi:hypothetical protein
MIAVVAELRGLVHDPDDAHERDFPERPDVCHWTPRISPGDPDGPER